MKIPPLVPSGSQNQDMRYVKRCCIHQCYCQITCTLTCSTDNTLYTVNVTSPTPVARHLYPNKLNPYHFWVAMHSITIRPLYKHAARDHGLVKRNSALRRERKRGHNLVKEKQENTQWCMWSLLPYQSTSLIHELLGSHIGLMVHPIAQYKQHHLIIWKTNPYK